MKKENKLNKQIKGITFKVLILFIVIVVSKYHRYLNVIILTIPFLLLMIFLYKKKNIEKKLLMKISLIFVGMNIYSFFFQLSNKFLLCMLISCFSFLYIRKIRESEKRNSLFLLSSFALLFFNALHVKGLL